MSNFRSLVLIPSYNTGRLLADTVAEVSKHWPAVWVVIDGSTDDSDRSLNSFDSVRLRVLRKARNEGKGAAVLFGLDIAMREGFTHALVMDADGQHPADRIAAFMACSVQHPDAMILGQPIFDRSAPWLRVWGRRISNWWAGLETGWSVGDSLFGFRVYPIAPLIRVMNETRWMRRFDFDPEAIVRLRWRGVPAVQLSSPVRYLSQAVGGVSHFRYGRDNIWLVMMHIRLLIGWLNRPKLLKP